MASLVHELQREALDPKVRVSDLLRKALVVSKKLASSEIEEWIQKELNGYKGGDDTPEYRIAHGRVIVDDPYSGMIPVVFKYPEKEELLSKMPFINSAAYLEHLYGSGSESSSILMSYNKRIGSKLMEEMKTQVPPVLQVQLSELCRIIDAIRNTILNWALKLEEDGIIGDGMTFSKEEKEVADKVSYNINNFYGDVTNSQVQQGTHSLFQSQTVFGIDSASLIALIEGIKGCMHESGLDLELVKELQSELDTLSAQANSPKPKKSIIKEGLLSIQRIIEGAAGSAVAQYLPQIVAFVSKLRT